MSALECMHRVADSLAVALKYAHECQRLADGELDDAAYILGKHLDLLTRMADAAIAQQLQLEVA